MDKLSISHSAEKSTSTCFAGESSRKNRKSREEMRKRRGGSPLLCNCRFRSIFVRKGISQRGWEKTRRIWSWLSSGYKRKLKLSFQAERGTLGSMRAPERQSATRRASQDCVAALDVVRYWHAPGTLAQDRTKLGNRNRGLDVWACQVSNTPRELGSHPWIHAVDGAKALKPRQAPSHGPPSHGPSATKRNAATVLEAKKLGARVKKRPPRSKDTAVGDQTLGNVQQPFS